MAAQHDWPAEDAAMAARVEAKLTTFTDRRRREWAASVPLPDPPPWPFL